MKLPKKPEAVTVFSRLGCPYCAKAKGALEEEGIVYEEVLLGRDITSRSLRAVTGESTTPQIFIGGKHIGDEDDLDRYLSSN